MLDGFKSFLLFQLVDVKTKRRILKLSYSCTKIDELITNEGAWETSATDFLPDKPYLLSLSVMFS